MSAFQTIRERMKRFMAGRYGTDALNRGLMILWILLLVPSLFIGWPWLYLPQLILCCVIFFRMLSRNVVRRQKENHTYYRMMKGLGALWRKLAVRIRDRKTANFFRCPACRADIRMPKKTGSF